MGLTESQISTLLSMGYGINTDSKFVTLEMDVLYSLANRLYQLGANRGCMHTVYKDSK